MKRTKPVLAFERLEAEMEVLSKGQQQYFMGGFSSSGEVTASLSQFFGKPVTSTVDADGNWMISIGGSSPIPLQYGLGEVTVTASGGITSSSGHSFTNFQEFFSSSNHSFDYSPYLGSSGYGSSGYGSSGYGSSGYGSSGSVINSGITSIREFLGTTYSLEYGTLRTSSNAAGLEYMDCSELVCRYLAAIGVTDGVQSLNTEALISYANSHSNLLTSVGTPQVGDIFIWRYNGNGHTGVVTGYNSSTDTVTTIEAISESPNSGHPGEQYHSVIERDYSNSSQHLNTHDGWKGYFRPNP